MELAGLEPATWVRSTLYRGRQDSNLQPPVLEIQQEWLNRAVCLLCAPVARLGRRRPLRPGETLNRAEWRFIAR